MSTQRRSIHVLSILGALLCCAPARAQQPAPQSALDETARELFEKGSRDHDQGNFARCRASLLAAWAIKQHPQIALNLGGCELKLGMHRDAAEHLGYFLREAPKDTPAARRVDAEAMYREACKRVARIQLQVDPPDAEVILDGKSLGRGPWAAEIVLAPGRRVLELRAEGRQTKQVTLAGAEGQSETITERLAPAGAPAAPPSPAAPAEGTPPSSQAPDVAPPPPAPLHPIMPIVYGGFALGGAALLTGIMLHSFSSAPAASADELVARMQADGVRCASPPQPGACTELLELREEQDGLANAGTGLLIGGGLVAAGAATYLLVSHLRARPTAATAVRVAPAVGKEGGGLWISGRF